MLRTYYSHYKPQYYDKTSQSTKIILLGITSSTTDTSPTIYYKLRDKWKFNIGGGLTINNIVFDATDSLIITSSNS